MANISLREYLRQINSLIEQKKIADAYEHSKHILKSYPKYIDIYRLLGKAYLESSRYEEAEGMFRRVLAVLPDDFVSHLGLSVVKEENNDLDTAIWHMERAYELKSTQTIHEELHRLFTQRDGVAPPKPLITRGALIRINVRSGLYQQALKEIDLALKEDSQRIDLEILRAQIYYQLNNIPNTLRFCQQVIKKRPYAYDINIILAEIADTPDQAEPFKQRLYELDPYTSFVTESTSLGDVQDDRIMIERLELHPLEETAEDQPSQPPDDINVEERYSDTQEVPTVDDSVGSFEDSTLLEAQSHESAHIPDWMKEAGWEAGTSKRPEEEQALINQYDEAGELPDMEIEGEIDELQEEELPEWIKDFAPSEPSSAALPSLFAEENEEDEKIAWLDAILSGDETVEPAPKREVPEEVDTPVEPKGMPTFGEDIEADQEWLEKISTQEGLMAEQQQSEDRPTRMPPPEEMTQFVFDDEEEDFSNLEEPAEIEEVGQAEEAPMIEAVDEDIDSAIAWLEGLAAKQGADEEVLFSAPETRNEQPEWIFDKEDEQELETTEEPIREVQALESSVEVEAVDETMPSIEMQSQEPAMLEESDEFSEETPTSDLVEEEEIEFTFEDYQEEEMEEKGEFAFEHNPEEEEEGEFAFEHNLKEEEKGEFAFEPNLEEEDEGGVAYEDYQEEEEKGELAFEHSLEEEEEGEFAFEPNLEGEDEVVFAFEYNQEIGSPESMPDAYQSDDESQEVPEWLKAIGSPERVTKPLTPIIPAEQIVPEEEIVEDYDDVSLEEEFEDDEEWDQLMTEEEEELQTTSVPETDRLATTAVLDFIKQEVDSDISEIDEWLKNLTPLPEDVPSMEEAIADEDNEEEGTLSNVESETALASVNQEHDHGPVDFIDDFFSEPLDEEENELATSSDEPYQWEQVYEEDDLPDWISDISEDDLSESMTQTSSTQEQDSDLPDMPSWITGEGVSAYTDQSQDELEIESTQFTEELDEEVVEDIKSEMEQGELAEVPESITPEEVVEIETEEPFVPFTAEETSADFEEQFILAKNQLHDGAFNEAYPQLERLMQNDQWTQAVIDVLLFDIDNYHPIEVHTWILLGDAYRKQNDLSQALDAYTKAENFIK